MDFLKGFDSGALTRGRAYARYGFVTSISGDQQSGLVSIVRNEKGRDYSQEIDLAGGQVSGTCTCPVGYNCKHVVAALITWQNRNGKQEHPPRVIDMTASSQYVGSSRGSEKVSTSETRATRWQPPLPWGVTQWVEDANHLQFAASRTQQQDDEVSLTNTYPEKVKDRLLYVLRIDGVQLLGSVWKGRLNAQGTHLSAKPKRYNVLQNIRRSVPLFIRPVDVELISALVHGQVFDGQSHYYSSLSYGLPESLSQNPWMGSELLEQLCDTGRCFVSGNLFGGDYTEIVQGKASHPDTSQPPLSWSSEQRSAELKWHTGRLGQFKLGFSAGLVGKIGKDLIWLDPSENKIGKLEGGISEDVLQFLARSPVLEPHEVKELATQFPTHLGSLPVPSPPHIEAVHRKAMHRLVRLDLDVAKTKSSSWYHEPAVILPTLKLSFEYEGQRLYYAEPSVPKFLKGNQIITLERDTEWEGNCFDRLQMCGAVDPFDIAYEAPSNKMAEADLVFDEDSTEEAIQFTFNEIPKLKSEGWEVKISTRWPFVLEEGEVSLSTFTQSADGESFQGHHWFDLGFQADVDGLKIDLAPLIASFMERFSVRYADEELPDLETFCADMEEASVYMQMRTGHYISVKLKSLLPVLYLFLSQQIELGNMHPSDARLAAQVQDALEGSEVKFSDQAGILPLAKSFESLLEAKSYDPPAGLQADLRPYQAVGAEWMTRLTQSGFGGVLADDMGLGKTLQMLTVLLSRKQEKTIGGDTETTPSLLIVPTSLLSTWQDQAAQFTPDLRLLIRHGKERHDALSEIKDADLVVTTYPLLSRDRDVLAELNWDLVIVDEAQTLKNPASQMAKALRDLSSKGRLALTGTPLENSLQDLWTLFDWVVPGLLGNRKTFTSLFRTPIEKKGSAEAQARLNRRVHPFLLRRTKEEVAADLPPRTEILEPVTLGKAQQGLYESVRATMDERVRDAVAARGFNQAQITILDALLKLRQVCCDPTLVKTKVAQSVGESAKRERLQELLQELLAEGRKVLVFSQFTSMLDLIAADLRKFGTDYTMLTGQTKDRKSVLERFASDEVSVFLLSLKAGGVGLTLTQADTVILYDPWWNPAAERQAMDRAHRIGQDKPVFVHRLVATGTVEEKVLALQAQKQALADAVLSSSDADLSSRFDEATLQDLFAPLVPRTSSSLKC